jgi:hypothetical protein
MKGPIMCRRKRPVLFLAFLLTVCNFAAAQAAPSACATHSEVVAPCFSFRGRLSFWNGTPSARIWRVGSKRILGVSDDKLPAELKSHVKTFDTELWGNFTVCPFTRSRPGHMQLVCIESWRDITTRER